MRKGLSEPLNIVYPRVLCVCVCVPERERVGTVQASLISQSEGSYIDPCKPTHLFSSSLAVNLQYYLNTLNT